DFADLMDIFRAVPNGWALLRYMRRLVRERRLQPKNDLISALVAAEEAGDKLNEDELLAMMALLLIAGYETTVNLISNGMLALLQNPQELRRLRDDDALMPTAVEELLRYESPLKIGTMRWAKCDMEIAGVKIRQGDGVA